MRQEETLKIIAILLRKTQGGGGGGILKRKTMEGDGGKGGERVVQYLD